MDSNIINGNNDKTGYPIISPFDRTIIDALSAHIAILDKKGVILETNRAWRNFGAQNSLEGEINSRGWNYIEICERAVGEDADTSRRAARGIRSVITSKFDEFTMEYPCHTPAENLWFYMRVTRIQGPGPHFVVISHENITTLKAAEEVIREREQELAEKTRNLEEANTALRVLVDQRQKDKNELEQRVVSNVRQLVAPYISKIRDTRLSDHQQTLLGIIDSHLNDVISPFLQKASTLHIQLTPGEIQVAVLVKEGLTTKEIANTMNISTHAVDFHRKNIRKKLGLTRGKTNLRSFLISLG